MPTIKGKDKDGCYYRWGQEGKKYYFPCNDKKAEMEAKNKARSQGIAIISSGYK